MVIEGLLSLIRLIFTGLLGLLHVPPLPTGIQDALQNVMEYLLRGLAWAASLMHWQYIKALFLAAVAIEVSLLIYKFVMWCIRKIPALNVS